jgi:hypothetical protein
MALERPPGAIRFMFRIEMQDFLCDFAPVESATGAALESVKGLPVYSIDHEVGFFIRPLPRHSSHFAG